MTTTNRTLIQAKYAENAQTTQTLLSSVSARAIIDKFSATNVTASVATLAVNIVASAGSASAANLILATKNLAAGETYNCPELVGQVLQPGDFISLIAGTASAIVIRVSGREMT